jgi:hypothetical protein
LTPETLAATPDPALRAAGLSANKLASLRDLSAKVLDGTVVLTQTSRPHRQTTRSLRITHALAQASPTPHFAAAPLVQAPLQHERIIARRATLRGSAVRTARRTGKRAHILWTSLTASFHLTRRFP